MPRTDRRAGTVGDIRRQADDGNVEQATRIVSKARAHGGNDARVEQRNHRTGTFEVTSTVVVDVPQNGTAHRPSTDPIREANQDS